MKENSGNLEKNSESENMSISDDGELGVKFKPGEVEVRKTMTILESSYVKKSPMNQFETPKLASKNMDGMSPSFPMGDMSLLTPDNGKSKTAKKNKKDQKKKDFSGILLTQDNREEKLSKYKKSFH